MQSTARTSSTSHMYSAEEAANCAFAASVAMYRAAIATYQVASALNRAAYSAITENNAEQAQMYLDQVTAELAIAQDHDAEAAVYQARGKVLIATCTTAML